MATYVQKRRPFTPAPAGRHRAVCVDVVDLGVVESQYGEHEAIRLAWQTEAKMDNGKPFIVTRTYNKVLTEASSLGKDLEAWFGEIPNADGAGYDLEDLIGKTCVLHLKHKEGAQGQTYANVQFVLPDDPDAAPLEADDYTRVCDREKAS